jgi:ParB family chromosome partitioning protein
MHCGTRSGFWRSLVDGVKRLFRGGGDRLEYVEVDAIRANPCQPREYVLDEPLDRLKESIRLHGVVVPIIVTKAAGGYQLVAGQRRLRAVRELGYRQVPAVVRSLDRRQAMEVSYLENLHREDLTKVDQVLMFDRIRRKYPQLSEEELAAAMGLNGDDLSHARRFLELPIPVQEALRAGMIGEEHAWIIEELDDPDLQLEVVEMVYEQKLSRDETRELVDRMLRRDAPYVMSEDGVHFHAPHCPYAQLIPADRKVGAWSKKEPAKRGKIPCMNCL